MKVYKHPSFQNPNPDISIILPIWRGEGSPHFKRLLAEIGRQTCRNAEVIIVEGVEPNGRARNEGVSLASGRWLVLIDETVTLGHERVIENLIRTLEGNSQIGAAGTSVLPSQGRLSWLQKEYFRWRRFESPLVRTLTESDQVQHSCMAISQKVFKEVGWESDSLLTGTDDDLRARLRKKGYRLYLVPEAWVFQIPPTGFIKMLRKGFHKGRGAAHAFLIFPDLFEPMRFLGVPIRNAFAALLYKLAATLVKTLLPSSWYHGFGLLLEWAVTFGFISGWLGWIGKTPQRERSDLRPPGPEKKR